MKIRLVTERQETKRLKKLLRQTKEVNGIVLKDYHNKIIEIEQSLERHRKVIKALKKKRFWQFVNVNAFELYLDNCDKL